jgi:hypothetical protein
VITWLDLLSVVWAKLPMSTKDFVKPALGSLTDPETRKQFEKDFSELLSITRLAVLKKHSTKSAGLIRRQM